jgi:CheY-like chemotaxis protein
MKYVLLIDDDPDSNILNSWLIKRKFSSEIDAVENAIDGLNLLKKKNLEGKNLPDMIFLDLRMPLMDGFGFLSEFEKLDKNIINHCKIVVLTSSFDRADHEKAIANKFVKSYINKPLSLEALDKLIS